MSTLYIPNPCLLGILLAVSTHDGHQVVFHYPPRPNEYGYKATPLAQQLDALNVDEGYYSSSSSSGDEMTGDEDDEDESDTRSALSGSSKSNSRTGSGSGLNSLTNDTNYISGKALLDMLDEQDRRRKRKEYKRQNLVRKILVQSGPSSNNNMRATDVDSNGTEFSGSRSKSIASGPNDNSNGSNNNSNSDNSRIDKLFGFDVDFLSEVVTPPKQLCNTRFELSVDDMAFLGLPIHVNEDGTWRKSSKSFSKARSKKERRSKNKSKTRKRNTSVSATGTLSPDGSDQEGNEELSGDESADENDETQKDEKTKRKEDCPMHLFHVVFVMNPPVIEYNYRIDEMFHYVVSRLALVLRYEQEKSNFIWKEASSILNLREKYSNLSINEQWSNIIEQSSLANLIAKSYLALSNSEILNIEINGRLRSFQIPIRKEFTSLPPKQIPVLPGSTLSSVSPFNALGLEENSHSISEDTSIHFALILLDDPELIIKDIRAEKDSVIATFIRMIKPTESLSRLSTLSGLDISEVKLFANHLVYWRRAKAVLPLTPRGIYIVSPIAPMSNLSKDSTNFKSQFPNLPGLPNLLSLISSSSSRPKQLSSIIPSREHRDLYLDAVSWMIKYGYLCQLNLFLWVRIPKKIKILVDEELEEEMKKKQTDQDTSVGAEEISKSRFTDNTSKANESANNKDAGSSNNTSNLANTSSSSSLPASYTEGAAPSENGTKIIFEEDAEEDTLLLDPESSTALEKRWIAKCVEGKSPDIVNLFYKLLKYMNGKNALELFVIEEGVSRQDVRKMISALDEYIVTVRHW